MKIKRIQAMLLCALLVIASFGIVLSATIGDDETEPTIDTVASPIMYEGLVAQITEQSNVQADATSVSFITGNKGLVKIKVGVPKSGYYNVAALIKASDGSENLDADLTVTTDRGESFTYDRTTRGGSWTYAPANVYLLKGDRILTFSSDMTGSKGIVMSGVRLYNITTAFVATENVSYEIFDAAKGVTVTAGDLFTPNIGVTDINSEKAVLEVRGATVVRNSEDWTKTAMTFTAAGEYTISISDDFFSNVVSTTITVFKTLETEPTIDTVAKPAMDADFVPLVTAVTNTTKGSTNVTFTAGQAGSFKIKVGVPVTGYYNISLLMTASDTTPNLDSDLTVTTDRGDSFTYSRTTRGGSWTYAPANVLLVKGDRILTFRSDMAGSKGIIVRGIRLYHMTKAFYALKDVSFEIPAGENSVTVNASEIFATDIGVAIDSSKVTIAASGATVVKNSSDWSQSTITFPAAGTYPISINDEFYGGVTSTTITVEKITGDLAPDDTETEPTINTVTTPAMDAAFTALITSTNNVTKGSTNATFTAGKAGSFKIKVGVPATGYYNISGLITASDTTPNLDTDFTVTTDRGDSFTYSRTTRGGSWTYAPANVYLVKGDRILTFRSDMTGSKGIIMRGIRLYHMTKAFYALKDVSFEIPAGENSVTVNASEIFATEIGVAANSSEVELTAEGATVVKNSSDWSKSTITFPAAGTYTVSIKDAFYGGTTATTITVTKK